MKIGILGATGSIGSWLTERLILEGHEPRIIVRGSLGNRLSRYAKLDVRRSSLRDTEELAQALEGVDVLINCVIDNKPTFIEYYIKNNVSIAKVILSACNKAGIKRLIHLSSIVVLPPQLSDAVRERPFVYSQEPDSYTRTKVETEKLFLHTTEIPEVCIIRPGIVYGPNTAWSTVGAMQSLQSVITLPREQSVCHAVHVDDVAGISLHLAKTTQPLPKMVYAINPETVSWREFYTQHAEVISKNFLVQQLPAETLQKTSKSPSFTKESFSWILSAPLIQRLLQHRAILALMRKLANAIQFDPTSYSQPGRPATNSRYKFPTSLKPFEVALYRSDAHFTDDEVGVRNGYQYRYSFGEGMNNTREWLRYQSPIHERLDQETLQLLKKSMLLH